MKRNIFKAILTSIIVGCSAVSCDYLNVGEEMSGGLQSNEDIFNDVKYTQRFYGQCFNNIPDYSRIWNAGAGIGGGWACFADELYTSEASKTGRYNAFTSYVTNGHRWYDLYKSIRQCNIFMEWVHPIMPDGQYAEKLDEQTVNAYKANVRFLRAMYHYHLFEQYGPIPVVDHSFDMENLADMPRWTVDRTVEWIANEFAACAKELHQEPYKGTEVADFGALPTKGVALAFRAKLLTYAARPLFNGSWEYGKTLVNNDGTALFPDGSQKEAKIKAAVEALEEFITYAETGGRYSLYYSDDRNTHKSLYELFQKYNDEIIWATAKTSWGKLGDQNFDGHATPAGVNGGLNGMEVLQEFVDDFYCSDGYSIKDGDIVGKSPLYNESKTENLNETNGGFIPDGTTTPDYYAIKGTNVRGMYLNREPRFYNSITFTGKTWPQRGERIDFSSGGISNNSTTLSFSGYTLYKRYARNLGQKDNVYKDSQFRPSIIFRLAEFYLLYAEMVNEMDPSDERVLTYLNKVRERAGLPLFGVDGFGENERIIGNQAKQRLVIQRESRIELATEGQRYFDVRTWLIADTKAGRQGGEFHGLNINRQEDNGFYTRTWCQNRVFTEKNYLYPLPLDEIKRSKELKQNPGW